MLLQKIIIEGAFPERALIRLKREKIPLFYAKKVEKNRILFSIKRKHTEKVFAIYQNLWYNENGTDIYTVKKCGGDVGFRLAETLKKRIGLPIGTLVFAFLCLFLQNFILQIKIVGETSYRREILQALEHGGLGVYGVYSDKNNPQICAEIFKLDGVSFCSIQKQGVTLFVEVRTNPFITSTLVEGDMLAERDGEVISVCALRGTAQVKAGDKVKRGQTLVSGYFCKQSGEQVPVEVIATAKLRCVYEAQVSAQTQEEAFADAYLQLGNAQNIQIENKHVTPCENGFIVLLQYTVWQAINL